MKNRFKTLLKDKNARVKIIAIILFAFLSLLVFISSSLISPNQIGYFANKSLDGPNSVFVLGDYAYIAAGWNNSLTIINVTNKNSPQQIGYFANESSLNGSYSVFVLGDYAYVASITNNSLTIINTTDKTFPQQIGYFANASLNGAYSVFVLGDYAYVASITNDSLTIINTTDKTSLQQIGYFTNRSLDGATSVFVLGDYAYVASNNNDSLTIINVTNKTSLQQIGYFTNKSFDALSVFVLGDYAYVASITNDSLTIINVTNKNSPQQIGYFTNRTLEGVYSVFVLGDYAYVASITNDSLTIINTTDKTSPKQVGYFINRTTLDGANSVFVLGDYAYVVSYDNDSLTIFNTSLSDYSSPAVSFSGITNTINNGNYSGTVIVNASVTDNHAINSVYFNVTYTNGTQVIFPRAFANGASYYNISLNTSEFFDNQYNITVYANDTAGNLNNSERIQITMHNTAPEVSFSGITNTINNGNYSGTVIVNASVTDNFFDSIYFNVTSTDGGTQFNFTRARLNGASYYNISLNTLGFLDNKYNITVYANDTLGNLNNSERIQITMDNTKPTGVMTCSPVDTNVGGTVSCTCTSTDATSGISSAGNTYTASPSTSVAGEGFTQTCTFADNAGNSGSAISNAYTIWSNVASESSTPTAPSTPPVDIITEAIPITQPEAPAEITINEPGLDLTAVTIETTETVEGLSVEVSTVSSPLSAEVGVAGNSYQAFEINTFTSSSKIKKAKLDFKVNKSWIAERQGKAKDVRLHRKENNSNVWDILPTNLIKEDNNSYYYAATTPGFSTFVIFLGTYECTPGEIRCSEKNIQMCLGNSTWLITEQCRVRCRDNQCTAAVPISLIVYCSLIAMAGIVVLFAVYLAFFSKKSGNKKEEEIISHFQGQSVSAY